MKLLGTPWTVGRGSVSTVTASVAPGASVSATLALGRLFCAFSISTSRPARVTLYASAAAMAADSSRAIGVDPRADAGVLLDYVTTDSAVHTLSPVVFGASLESPPVDNISMRVTNMDSATGTITVSLNSLRVE